MTESMNQLAYRHALAQLHLTQVAAAKMFGVNESTSRRWATGRSPIPRPVAIALLLMLQYHIVPNTVMALIRRHEL